LLIEVQRQILLPSIIVLMVTDFLQKKFKFGRFNHVIVDLWPHFYCACTEMAISALWTKILIKPLDSATPIPYYVNIIIEIIG